MTAPTIPVIPETAKVGETLELFAETFFAHLADLEELRIYFRQGRRAIDYRVAELVPGQPTQMTAVIESEDNDLACDARLWAYGRGSGTIRIRFGKTAILRITEVDR